MLEAIRVFIKSAECGSFSKAGAVLGLSPSSVSRQIGKLESALATKLFKRSTRHLTLTASGQTLLEQAGKALSDLEAAFAQVRPDSREVGGDLRISAFESFGRICVCPRLPGFLHQYPAVKIELLLENQIADLYRDEVDLAIRIGRPADSRLKARKLAENRMTLCASPEYVRRHGMPDAPEDLRARNCLVLSRSRRVASWYFRRAGEARKIQIDGNLRSIGGTPLLEAALQGLGLALLPAWMAAVPLASGALQAALTQWQANLYENGSGDVYAVYLEDPHTKPAIRVFIDYFSAHFPRIFRIDDRSESGAPRAAPARWRWHHLYEYRYAKYTLYCMIYPLKKSILQDCRNIRRHGAQAARMGNTWKLCC